ncbi:MAG: hypothetical protein AAFX10_04235 [Pseudomonadota bacterium]
MNFKSVLTLLSLAILAAAASADEDAAKRQRVLEFLEYTGAIESIELQVETMQMEYQEYYAFLPRDFWERPGVVDAFDAYKVALLRGYVEAMQDDLSDEDLDFLVDFYASEDGQRVIALGKRLDPLYVAAASEASKEFMALFEEQLEGDVE